MDKQTFRRTLLTLSALLVLLALPVAYVLTTSHAPLAEKPEVTLKHYLEAIYAQDYRTAYQWISLGDKNHKSKKDYLRENPSFAGLTLKLTRILAEMIEFRNLRSEIRQHRATVKFTVKMPNANAPTLRALLLDFDPERLSRLTRDKQRILIEKLENLRMQGELPVLEGEESWDLVKEPAGWRVFLNWTGAIRVLFEARVKGALPWRFWPVQNVVLATPGKTLQAVYRAKNLSDEPVTAKARHIDEPKDLAGKYLQIIQCFCFIQETLAPGEEKELPLVFRVHWDAPDEVKEFRITYEFYPIEKFPFPEEIKG
jgi:hypothetical protein